MPDNFDALPWHDAEIQEIIINRRNPGELDTVSIFVKWPNGSNSKILFSDCYALKMEMNFGILAKERILDAMVVEDDTTLFEIRAKWERLGVSLNFLTCYRIETSSTGSVIRVYANRFEIIT